MERIYSKATNDSIESMSAAAKRLPHALPVLSSESWRLIEIAREPVATYHENLAQTCSNHVRVFGSADYCGSDRRWVVGRKSGYALVSPAPSIKDASIAASTKKCCDVWSCCDVGNRYEWQNRKWQCSWWQLWRQFERLISETEIAKEDGRFTSILSIIIKLQAFRIKLCTPSGNSVPTLIW